MSTIQNRSFDLYDIEIWDPYFSAVKGKNILKISSRLTTLSVVSHGLMTLILVDLFFLVLSLFPWILDDYKRRGMCFT